MVNVNWSDAIAFCQWLSEKEGLPTEAEWEYACRAGSRRRFLDSDRIEDLQMIANLQDQSLVALEPKFSNSDDASYLRQPVAWNDQHAFTAPVGSFRCNAFGLYDMLGNVAEWCSDWHGADYYVQSPTTDPQGPELQVGGRVVRGGAFLHQPHACRVTWRIGGTPTYQNYVIGFRVVGELGK